MPQRILALDISDSELKAAVLETTFRDYQVAGFYREPLAKETVAPDEQIRRFSPRTRARRRHHPLRPAGRPGHLAHVLPALSRQEEAHPDDPLRAREQRAVRPRRGRGRLPGPAPRPRRHHGARRARAEARPRAASRAAAGGGAPIRRSSTSARCRRSTRSAWSPTCRRRSRSSISRRTSATVALYREGELVGLRTLSCGAPAPPPESTQRREPSTPSR